MKINFKKELQYAKNKLQKRPEQKEYLSQSITLLLNYTKKMKEQGQEESKIMEKILNDIVYTILKYIELSDIYSIQKQYNTIKLYANNKHLIERDYKNLSTKQNAKEQTKGKINESETEQEIILQEILNDLKQEKKHLQAKQGFNELKKLNKKDQQKIIKKLSPKARKIVEKNFKITTGTELEELQEYIKYKEEECEEKLKQRYIEILKQAGNFLKKFGFLQKDVEIYKKRCKELSMPGIIYPLTKEEKEQGDIAVEEIFEQETLKQFSIEQLAFLNIFWQNRFVKLIKDISNAMFAIRTLPTIEKNIDFNDVNTENIIYKKLICDNIFFTVVRNLKRIEKQKEKNNEKHEEENNEKQKEEFIAEYEEYFNKEIPECENSFKEDIKLTNIYANLEINAYNTKAALITFFIQDFLSNNSKVTNWGVIPEDKQENKNYIIIGIDYPGFNMPVKVHILKEEIKQYIYNLQGNMILPIYKGNKDMIYKGRHIKTNILMPLTKKRQEYIIDKVASLNPVDLKYLLIKHLGNLVTIKNKKTTKIYPEKYIDLQTGKTGIKINRNFIADENETETKNDKEISQK